MFACLAHDASFIKQSLRIWVNPTCLTLGNNPIYHLLGTLSSGFSLVQPKVWVKRGRFGKPPLLHGLVVEIIEVQNQGVESCIV